MPFVLVVRSFNEVAHELDNFTSLSMAILFRKVKYATVVMLQYVVSFIISLYAHNNKIRKEGSSALV